MRRPVHGLRRGRTSAGLELLRLPLDVPQGKRLFVFSLTGCFYCFEEP